MTITGRLSIGLPVRNGVRYLGETIECLRNQTFEDFDVLIADNASTDETELVARAAVEADARFRYVRHERNIGLIANWNYVRAQTHGELFSWMGADDRCDSRFYERCVRLLDERPDAIAAFSQSAEIDEIGQLVEPIVETARGDHPDPAVRFGDFASYHRHHCQMCYAVMRRTALDTVEPKMLFPGCDRLFFAELALRGRFVRAPETLFFNRGHVGRSSWNGYDVFYRDAGITNGPRAVRVYYWRQLWRIVSKPQVPADVRRRARLRLVGFTARNAVSLARSAGSAARNSLRDRLRARPVERTVTG